MSNRSFALRAFSMLAGVCMGLVLEPLYAQEVQLRVYRPDGSLQCGMGSARSLAEDQKDLESLGAKVISSEKKLLPVRVSMVCGAPTGRSNTYVITESDWHKIRSSFVGPSKFGRWIFDSKTVVVYKYDGTLQCGSGTEAPLDVMAKELTGAGIKIESQRKSTDGLIHIALCGSVTGSVNTYEIAHSDLDKALDMGFSYFIDSEISKKILDREAHLAPATEGLPLPWPIPW